MTHKRVTTAAEIEERSVQRFKDNLIKGENPDDCWGWAGHIDSEGYANMKSKAFGSRMINRVSWMLFVGEEIPEGAYVRRTCKNRACANPRHLVLSKVRCPKFGVKDTANDIIIPPHIHLVPPNHG